MRVLLLGGTTEASALARLLVDDARFEVSLSLAGRTSSPRAQPLPTRVGGFGGTDGLADWIERECIEAVIDATHPYAARISANAVAACARCAIPLGSLLRPPWRASPGDRWIEVASAEAAATALGDHPQRVFLALGRLEIVAFAAAPQHDYLARMIERPDGVTLPPRFRLRLDRGPFAADDELRLLTEERIDVVVSKNSGGEASYGKIAAARRLKLPVLMIARPAKPAGIGLVSPEAARDWLEALAAHRETSRSPRGV